MGALRQLWGAFVTDLYMDPLTAKSRTADRLGHVDFYMVVPPLRALFWYSMVPILAFPIACMHVFGYYRCLATCVRPQTYRKKRYEDKIYYGVQRRLYDEKHKKINEYTVDNPEEIQHALSVTNGVRNQFIDDPTHSGRAYFVVEQRVVRMEAMFTAENWTWAAISDAVRFLVPVGLAYLYRQPVNRFVTDVRLWRQGRLHWRQVRHPILNFFSTYRDYNVAMRRVNVVKPLTKEQQAAKSKNPWL